MTCKSTESYESWLDFGRDLNARGMSVARTHALEALVICSFLRGLSVRDVEGALEECFGEQVIGKSTVARVCKDVAARYAAWCDRDLSIRPRLQLPGRDLPQAQADR